MSSLCFLVVSSFFLYQVIYFRSVAVNSGPILQAGDSVFLLGIKVVSKRFSTAKGINPTKQSHRERGRGSVDVSDEKGILDVHRRWILDVGEYAIGFPGSVLDESERGQRGCQLHPPPLIFKWRTLCPDGNLQLSSAYMHSVNPHRSRKDMEISLLPGYRWSQASAVGTFRGSPKARQLQSGRR